MRRLAMLAAATTVALIPALAPGTAGAVRGPGAAQASGSGIASPGWSQAVPFRRQVVSSPVSGGGYRGAKPSPGGCARGRYNSNFSEGALALRRGTDQLVGASKAYFARWSTFKAEHTVSFSLSRHHGRHSPLRARTHFIGGFDCATTGSQAMPPSWTNVTDPNLVWDHGGRVHQLVLAFNAFWGSVKQPNGNVYSVYSDDAGRTWKPGNGGRPVEAGPELSVDSTTFLDKPWITANQNASDPRRGHLYGAWVLFKGDAAEIHTAVSRTHGRTWTTSKAVPTPQRLGPSNPWPMVDVGPDGVVYLSYVSYGTPSKDGSSVPATLWSARSTDDGRTWGGFSRVARTTAIGSSTLPGTTLHRPIVQYLAVSPDRPGHLYVAWNRLRHGQVDVMIAASHNGGHTWSRPLRVNDDHGSRHQFSATVAAGPRGAVAVGFYDMRARCPRHDPAILRSHRGRAGTCIGLTLQPFHDGARGLHATRHNLLVSRHLWDPYQPGGTRGGLRQQACEDAVAHCDNIFLGDFFSMQVSGRRVYLLSVSTHPRSSVRGDGGRRLHYQQQLLTTVDRRDLGL